MFSLNSFVVLALIFRCLTYFELIVMSDVREGSDFMLLYVDSPLFIDAETGFEK